MGQKHKSCLGTSVVHRYNRTKVTSWLPLKRSDKLTFAFAFLYALAHAGAKSGTSAGLPTGGGCLGELAGYTPIMGGSEDGDGKGAK